MSFRRSGSQKSNASNGSQIRVEMKKLEPMEADHSKLKANFAGLRNQPLAAKSDFGCEMVSLTKCRSIGHLLIIVHDLDGGLYALQTLYHGCIDAFLRLRSVNRISAVDKI